ncbi:MAG: hypothetical protein ACT4P5_06320, partial [Armatimonadota bacterium]
MRLLSSAVAVGLLISVLGTVRPTPLQAADGVAYLTSKSTEWRAVEEAVRQAADRKYKEASVYAALLGVRDGWAVMLGTLYP